MNKFDAIVVGGGIVGLATAAALHKQGAKTLVIERNAFATGATVRNFGMLWPIGQTLGEMRDIAMRSRELWLENLNHHGIWFNECGSLHLAYAADEYAVLEEYVRIAADPEIRMLTPEETMQKSRPLRQDGLLGAMWSPYELCVDPRITASKLARALESSGVEFRFGRSATHVASGRVATVDAEFTAERIYVCPGADSDGVGGKELADAGMEKVRLQMLRVVPNDASYQIGAHLCAGLTLLHYRNFRDCASLGPLRARLVDEMPDYMEHGIHVLVSQHGDGSLTLGDSHHYGPHFAPYSSEAVDDLILEYLDRFLPTESFSIAQRWDGVYGKHPVESFLVLDTEPGVTIIGALGGAGMTLSFGVTERVVNRG